MGRAKKAEERLAANVMAMVARYLVEKVFDRLAKKVSGK